MNPLPVLLNPLVALPRTHRWLLLCAAIVALSLISAYVQTLHDSLTRAGQLREAFLLPVAKALAKRPAPQLSSELPRPQEAASVTTRQRRLEVGDDLRAGAACEHVLDMLQRSK